MSRDCQLLRPLSVSEASTVRSLPVVLSPGYMDWICHTNGLDICPPVVFKQECVAALSTTKEKQFSCLPCLHGNDAINLRTTDMAQELLKLAAIRRNPVEILPRCRGISYGNG